MQKFDPSCGLSKKEIGIIKYNVKNEISRQLPELPDPVETKLFLEGREAWIFSWRVLNDKHQIESNDIVYLEVVAKLKREFHHYSKSTHHKFLCNVQMQKNIYHPKLLIAKDIT